MGEGVLEGLQAGVAQADRAQAGFSRKGGAWCRLRVTAALLSAGTCSLLVPIAHMLCCAVTRALCSIRCCCCAICHVPQLWPQVVCDCVGSQVCEADPVQQRRQVQQGAAQVRRGSGFGVSGFSCFRVFGRVLSCQSVLPAGVYVYTAHEGRTGVAQWRQGCRVRCMFSWASMSS